MIDGFTADIIMAVVNTAVLCACVPALRDDKAVSLRLYMSMILADIVMLVSNALYVRWVSDGGSVRMHAALVVYSLTYYLVLALFTWSLICTFAEFRAFSMTDSLTDALLRDTRRLGSWMDKEGASPMKELPDRTIAFVVSGVCVFSAMVWLLTLPTEWYGQFEDGARQYGIMRTICSLGAYFVVGADCYLIIRHRKLLTRSLITGFIACIVTPVLAAVYRVYNPSPVILCFSLSLMLFLIFIGVQIIKNRRLFEQEQHLVRARTDIILTQIQPHFIYNTLNTIYHLCGSAPKKAQTATGLFADYLRANLDSLYQRAPVPFKSELKHVRTYLTLEQMRFEERLSVVYDIQTEDFLLPALTVQPLVENAVRHGIGKREEGGTVTIRTFETEHGVTVQVIDDGVGMTQTTIDAAKRKNAAQGSGRVSIGLDNVRERLWELSGAMLEVTNENENGGVTVTFEIPTERVGNPRDAASGERR